ncbi:MAG: TRAP transporter large permease subunit, partial [Gammaproteobacteria bacterium]|nr:TRAP transporter large permease subunit [Gammaproteobacteria bacterium]
MASISFIEAERSANLVLAYGIPVWVMQMVIPITYAIIAIRLLKGAGFSAISMSIAVLIIAAVTLVIMYAPVSNLVMRLTMLVVVLCAALLGTPVFVVVAGAALILLWTGDIPLASMILDQYSLVSNHLLPSIPLFTLAGVFLAESRAPQRLIELFDAWFGQIRGGPAIATVLVATFFTCFTGASGVTILALGGLLMPLLINAGYSKNRSLGLITGGGSAGVLLMPALPLILYAIVANVTIEAMFLGGLLPALLMLTIAAAWGIHILPVKKEKKTAPFDKRRAIRAIWNAKWELFLPVVLLTGMFSGLMTTLEASAVTAFYIFIVEVFIHRDLSLRKDVLRVLVQCGLLVGGILMILGMALGLT